MKDMKRVSDSPWDNLNFVVNKSIGTKGFKYFENMFQGIYQTFLNERTILLSRLDHGNDDYHEASARFEEIVYFNALFVILGCAIIESWVNAFGIHLLEDRFYHKNVERLGIIEKINILFAIHLKVELDVDNPILKEIRELFDERNQLIHPKSKHMTPENIASFAFDHSKVDDLEYRSVKQTLENVKKFFSENGIIAKGLEEV